MVNFRRLRSIRSFSPNRCITCYICVQASDKPSKAYAETGGQLSPADILPDTAGETEPLCSVSPFGRGSQNLELGTALARIPYLPRRAGRSFSWLGAALKAGGFGP